MAKKAQAPWAGWQNTWMRNEQFNKAHREKMCLLAEDLRMNSFMGIWPSAPQIGFMMAPEFEVLYGGERRAGKTSGMLLSALQNITVEGYVALILRQSIDEMRGAGGIITTAFEWFADFLRDGIVEWNEERKEFLFKPYNSVLKFDFMKMRGDEQRHLGKEYAWVGLEELTRYEVRGTDLPDPWNPYSFMFGSLANSGGLPIETKMRASSNPGGVGEPWVMSYFLPDDKRVAVRVEIDNGSYMIIQPIRKPDPETGDEGFSGIAYIHALHTDNPGLDQVSYNRSLARMKASDPITYEQLGKGKWGVVVQGDMFKTEKIKHVPFMPTIVMQRGRGIDKAYTQGGTRDRTACVRMSRLAPGVALQLWGGDYAAVEFVIEHVITGHWGSELRENNIDVLAEGGTLILEDNRRIPWPGDPVGTFYRIERERSGGGESAQITVARLIRKSIIAEWETALGDKANRAHQFSNAVNNGMVAVVDDRSWDVADYLNELKGFPKGKRDDQVDASSLVYNKLVLTQPSSPPVAGKPRFGAEQRRLVNKYV